MSAPNCILRKTARNLASETIKLMPKDQQEKLGIDTKDDMDIVTEAIASLVQEEVGAIENAVQQDKMLDDAEGFLKVLQEKHLQKKISKEEWDKGINIQYERAKKYMGSDRIYSFQCSEEDLEDEDTSNHIENLRDLVKECPDVITYKEVYLEKEGVTSYEVILREPVITDDDRQQKAIEVIDRIASLEHTNLGAVKDDRGQKTGKTRYRYNGQNIESTSVSVKVNGYNPDAEFPMLSGPIGTAVDTIGRGVFNSKSRLYDPEGNLADDESLQTFINTELKGLFSVEGLKRLVGDFKELEKRIKAKWGEDAKIISKEITLFGQDEKGDWVTGIPDFLVVDGKGKVHVLDCKTHILANYVGDYNSVVHDEYGSNKKYGQQVSYYIGMLQSHGLDVDPEAYVVLIDTWYNTSDYGVNNYAGKGENRKLKEGRKAVYEKQGENFTVSGTAQTLGEYAENEGNPLMPEKYNADRHLLYIEPRLHITYDSKNGFSHGPNAQNALLGKEDIPFTSISFKRQMNALSPEEKSTLSWYFPGTAQEEKTATNITKTSAEEIDGRPELIGRNELQFLANYLMVKVSKTISSIQNGEEYLDDAFEKAAPRRDGKRPLEGKSRIEIVKRIGINNLIDYIFNEIVMPWYDPLLPTLDDYRNDTYDHDLYPYESEEDLLERIKINEKAKFIIEKKDQFIQLGSAKLTSMEKFIIPQKKDSSKWEVDPEYTPDEIDTDIQEEVGDNTEAMNNFSDLYIEGLTDLESWMLNLRNYSPKASLAQEIKYLFERDLYQTDDEGNYLDDPYGWGLPVPVDPVQATQAVFDITRDCESLEEMMTALEKATVNPKNLWIKDLLDKLNEDRNLMKKFYRHFRKDALFYSVTEVQFDKESGQRIYSTRIINKKPAYSSMMAALSADFKIGEVGKFEINGTTLSVVHYDKEAKKNVLTLKDPKHTVATYILNRESALEKVITRTLPRKYARLSAEERENISFPAYVKQQLQEEEIVSEITNLLHGIGIMVPRAVVWDTILKDLDAVFGKLDWRDLTDFDGIYVKDSNLFKILDYIGNVCELLSKMHSEGAIPNGMKGNKAFGFYKHLCIMLSNSVQEHVESSSYQDGKTYYTFAPPSQLNHIVRNLKNAKKDNKAFQKYIDREFGRYAWFSRLETDENLNTRRRYLCDWVQQAVDQKGLEALDHKVEISFLGDTYRDLGSLEFQLSILRNYFGSKDDDDHFGGGRWFAVPTMSNKPVNEFIHMKIYGSHEDIIDNVLMSTFQQEMGRMADVLYHYISHEVATDKMDLTDKALTDKNLGKNRWTETELEGLKQRIDKGEVTAEDLIKLQPVTSGAKFHFLWYLNDEIAKDREFADQIASTINLLLKGDDMTSAVDELENTIEVHFRAHHFFTANTLSSVREKIKENMERIVEDEVTHMREIGIFDTKQVKVGKDIYEVYAHQEEFKDSLGSPYKALTMQGTWGWTAHPDAAAFEKAKKDYEEGIRDFIWEDIAANINIIQITGGDLAFYGNAVNYQKRIAQIHSSGLHMAYDKKADEEVTDGYIRSVYVSDDKVRDEIQHNAEAALEGYMEEAVRTGRMSSTAAADYSKMIKIISSELTKALSTDGQSLNSPTSIRKKLYLQGEWSTAHEDAYNKIKSGDFSINNLGVMMQPSKPFVTSGLAKYSGSPTTTLRKVPIQDKNSEYLLLLAEALAVGAGKQSKLAAIVKFMEKSAGMYGRRENTPNNHGIDTVHFGSVNKVGKMGVLDMASLEEEWENYTEDMSYEDFISDRMLEIIHDFGDLSKSSMEEAGMEEEEMRYNPNYVNAVPVEDYIIQQEVPAHMLDHNQRYGSQIRILGVSDITPGTQFDVRGDKIKDADLIKEYKELHEENITAAFEDLMAEIGIFSFDKEGKKDESKTIDSLAELKEGPVKNRIYENLSELLQKEMAKDSKYTMDQRRSCGLLRNERGNVVDFLIPLSEGSQSTRVQMLLNSIIKKRINKQEISGGPVVQATAYDENLHIKFKGEDGNPLKSFNEYVETEASGLSEEEAIKQYKNYLKSKKASIAHFECYVPVPNKTLERMLTKPDGSMMSFKEAEKKLPAEVWKSLTEFIGYRIPTEDKYSMLPLKVVGFLPKAAGQVIMMPQEITYLTGSDFDIDKMYLMFKEFEITVPDPSNVQSLMDQYKEFSGTKTFIDEYYPQIGRLVANAKNWILGTSDRPLTSGAQDGFINWILGTSDMPFTSGLTMKEKNALDGFIKWYTDKLFKETFTEFKYIKDHPNKDRRKARKERSNRILDLQWAVLTNADTMPKMLNPGNFNEQKEIGRIIRIIKGGLKNPDTEEAWTWEELKGKSIDELDRLLEGGDPHNTTLPSSKIYFQHQNMQGTQMVGIFANNNVSHAFCSFQHIGIDLEKEKKSKVFVFDGHRIGVHANPTVLDPQVGFDGRLISKTIASFLAAAVDTAKDPVLADLNVNTFTGGVAMALARMGFDTEAIGLFLSQPVIVKLTEEYFKNRGTTGYWGTTAIQDMARNLGMSQNELEHTASINDGRTLTKNNFIAHLNDGIFAEAADDFQKRVLIAFNILFKIADDLKDLTYCTKFNSMTNAVGPQIANTLEIENRVTDFTSKENENTNVFYIPAKDEKVFTNPAQVIQNDPILRAFFNNTIGVGGASERLFEAFFHHYSENFKEVINYFKENYLGKRKLNSKMLNKLANHYLYYCLTYEDAANGIMPVIPTNQDTIKRLVGLSEQEGSGIVNLFKKVQQIKGRRPNLLLDEAFGDNCLQIRRADSFLAMDTLYFNSSGIGTEEQQSVAEAWADLITMNDANLSKEDNEAIRRFGVNLFFYYLMRTAFDFNAKTLSHLASAAVKLNAQYAENRYAPYLEGIRRLLRTGEGDKNFDMDILIHKKAFCDQFVRNNFSNGQIVPTFKESNLNDNVVVIGDTLTCTLEKGVTKERDIYKHFVQYNGDKLKTNIPYQLIAVAETTEDGRFRKVLYQLQTYSNVGNVMTMKYKRIEPLGVRANFVEYNANVTEEVLPSIFNDVRNNSEDVLGVDYSTKENSENSKDRDSEDYRGTSNPETDKLRAVTHIFIEHGEGNAVAKYYRAAPSTVKADLVQSFDKLLAAKTKQERLERIKEINDKCK